MTIQKGSLFLLSCGDRCSYRHLAILRANRDLDTEQLRATFAAEQGLTVGWHGEDPSDDRFCRDGESLTDRDYDYFFRWLLATGAVTRVPCAEWSLGDFGELLTDIRDTV